MQQCLLCNSPDNLTDFFKSHNGVQFFECKHCGFIFKSPQNHLSGAEQEARYKFHQNDVLDTNYQNFLRPVVDAVLSKQNPQDLGLDFGCGPASVIAHLLEQNNYQMVSYDPLFHPEPEILQKTYDYITCTEVVEHFTSPQEGFQNLRKLLRPGGRLYIKTSLTDEVKDFANWYYHRDPTHVGFYNKKSLKFIRSRYEFADIDFYKDYVLLVTLRS